MTQILFGQSYYLRFDPKLWDAMMPYPPLGTMYAASYIRGKGYDVALFDAMLADSEDEWALSLDNHRPQYAIIFEDNFNYLSKMCLLRMREAAFTMIEMAKHGNIASKSDLEVGAKSLETGIWGAFKNVEINLPAIDDEGYKKEILDEANLILENAGKNFRKVCAVLGKR